jgi:hypothetical protein
VFFRGKSKYSRRNFGTRKRAVDVKSFRRDEAGEFGGVETAEAFDGDCVRRPWWPQPVFWRRLSPVPDQTTRPAGNCGENRGPQKRRDISISIGTRSRESDGSRLLSGARNSCTPPCRRELGRTTSGWTAGSSAIPASSALSALGRRFCSCNRIWTRDYRAGRTSGWPANLKRRRLVDTSSDSSHASVSAVLPGSRERS